MKKNTIYTDNDDLFEADQAIKKFTESHELELSDEEHEELAGLLDRRAEAISEVLGVRVGSIGNPNKKK